MVERGDRLGLAFEALLQVTIVGELLRQNFDSDGALQPRIADAVDFTHATRAQRRDDLVRPEFRAGLQSQLAVDYSSVEPPKLPHPSRAIAVAGNQELIHVK